MAKQSILLVAIYTMVLVARPATAERLVVKNDSIEGTGPAVTAGAFSTGEHGGARLTSPSDGDIVAVQILWLGTQTCTDTIHIYDEGTFPTPGSEWVRMEIQIGGGLGWDELELPESIPVTAGQSFYVTIEFDAISGDCGTGLARDTDGCQSERNVLYGDFGMGLGWYDYCSFGGPGDLAIRAVVDDGVDDGLPTQSNWVGGEQGEWGNANNWNPAIVPDNNDLLKFIVDINSIRSGVNEIEVGLRQSWDVNHVDCYGVVELQVWPHDWQNDPVELTIYNGLTNYGNLQIEGYEHQFTINANVTNTAGAQLGLYEAEIHGNLYNLGGATIEVENENDVDGDLQNKGIVIIPHASDLLVDRNIRNVGLIQLFDGECASYEIFDNNSTGVIKGFGVLYAEQLLRNKGEISARGGSLVIITNGFVTNSGTLSNVPLSSLQIKPAEDVNNNGTIEVHSGGGVAIDSNVVNEPNATILLLGGTLAAASITQSAEANFAGFGTITGDVVIDPNGIIRLIGSTNVVGNMEIGTDATLEISDGTTLIIGETTCNGTIHMIGGRIIPRGGLSGNCNIIWEPGTYTNIADFNLDGTVNFKDFADFANTWLWKASWY